MLKSLMVAGSVALSALAITTGAADAKARVGIYFGVPFYDYQAGPGWRYYNGYGWYDYGRYGEFRHKNRGRFISCNEARRMVDRSGYDAVRMVECSAPTYTFRAINRNGKRVTVYVNARNGSIWRG